MVCTLRLWRFLKRDKKAVKSILQGLKSLNLLEQNLKLRAQKHLQIVSNIANFSNPDYKAFEMVLDVPGPGQGCSEALGELLHVAQCKGQGKSYQGT